MRLRGQSGSVALMAMLGLFLLGLLGGAYYFLGQVTGDPRDKAGMEARGAYDEAVARLEKALNNPANVDASLDRNAGFQCLTSTDGNCRGQGGAFLLYEAGESSHPLTHLAHDAGADAYGSPCKGYPSKDCPLRVETVWEPVCGDDRCESTKSLRVKAKVSLAPTKPGEAPIQWTKEQLFTPTLKLSLFVQCARGGGEWSGKECLSPSQAAERRIASPASPLADAPPPENPPEPPREGEAPAAGVPPVFECPNQIVVQGQYYPVQFLASDRGQVSVPAMSCQASGFQDVFVFQCTAKIPAAFPNEGQWIQVEAVMAPACDQNGNSLPGGETLPMRY